MLKYENYQDQGKKEAEFICRDTHFER